MKLIVISGLIFAFGVIFSTLSQTPAFSSKLRSQTVLNTWRTLDPESMYDKGSYDFQRGYGFLMSDIMLPEALETADGRGEQSINHVQMAIEALEQSVKLDPGNAHAWLSLGWAYARSGDLDKARENLDISWRLAPHNVTLAGSRLDLSTVVFNVRNQLYTPTEAEDQAIRADFAAIDVFRAKQSDRYRSLLKQALDLDV